MEVRATLGFEPGDKRFAAFLNRQVRLTGDGLELEADPRHAFEIIRATPIVREPESTATHDYFSTRTARQSSDQYACDGIPSRKLRVKCTLHQKEAGQSRNAWRCPFLMTTIVRWHQPERIRIVTDSNHAGCRKTRTKHKFDQHTPRHALLQHGIMYTIENRVVITRERILRVDQTVLSSHGSTVTVQRCADRAENHRVGRRKQRCQFGTTTRIGKRTSHQREIPLATAKGT